MQHDRQSIGFTVKENAISTNKIMTVIGMMSGTSMDGVDVAVLRTDGHGRVEKLFAAEYAYDPAFKAKLEQGLEDAAHLTREAPRNENLIALEKEITQHHIAAVRQVLKTLNLTSDRIDLIGFHGQTVLHRPNDGFTVQLGDGQKLADETGISVVYDMRSNDMSNGGQGAPLVPVFHQALARTIHERLPQNLKSLLPVAFVNIGGISNISYVGSQSELIAFDTGPGNALIDQWVQSQAGIPFDQGGAIAAEGAVVSSIVDQYLDESFFEQTVPKSLDRNDFKPLTSGAASLEDGARTLAHVSAAAIIKSCDHLPESPKLWIICGGGRKNPKIMEDLKDLAKAKNGAAVILSEEAGLDGDSMEAEAWAYLAVRSLKDLPLTFPATTGCVKPVSGGRLAIATSRE